ncbi:MAG: hypothetical protein O7B99_05585 [Planctomycetota bacterium]|nr:hypothetical protein [Planctomycetota bacterium]
MVAAFVLVGVASFAAAQDLPGVRERNGPRLEVRDGRLVRILGPRNTIEIGSTDPGGPGTVRALAADPAGLTFVAAERGLYVLAPRIDHLDRLELQEGAPPGAPTSVFVDAKRRVWVATEEAFGVIDPSFHWGRTLTAADGLPAPGPYRVRVGPSDELVVSSAGGVLRYQPDQGDPPAVTAVRIDGRAWNAVDVLQRTSGEPIRIEVEGTASGGATFRWRLDGHHVWLALEPGFALEVVPPGEHTVEIVALDRDLRRSEPFAVRMRIAYPRHFDQRFVVVAGAVAGLILVALFLVRARRVRTGGGGYARAVVSAALALVIALQVLAGVVPHAKGWPFIGFAMYTQRYVEGQAIHDALLVGLLPRGRERAINPQEIGVAVDSRWQVLRPVIEGGDSVARSYVETYNERFPGRRIEGLQVQARRIRLTAEGPIRVAPLILAHYGGVNSDGRDDRTDAREGGR